MLSAVMGMFRAHPPPQQREAVRQMRADLLQRQGTNPVRRQLQRQGNTIQTGADMPDRIQVVRADSQPGSGLVRTLKKQLDRRIFQYGGGVGLGAL